MVGIFKRKYFFVVINSRTVYSGKKRNENCVLLIKFILLLDKRETNRHFYLVKFVIIGLWSPCECT